MIFRFTFNCSEQLQQNCLKKRTLRHEPLPPVTDGKYFFCAFSCPKSRVFFYPDSWWKWTWERRLPGGEDLHPPSPAPSLLFPNKELKGSWEKLSRWRHLGHLWASPESRSLPDASAREGFCVKSAWLSQLFMRPCLYFFPSSGGAELSLHEQFWLHAGHLLIYSHLFSSCCMLGSALTALQVWLIYSP